MREPARVDTAHSEYYDSDASSDLQKHLQPRTIDAAESVNDFPKRFVDEFLEGSRMRSAIKVPLCDHSAMLDCEIVERSFAMGPPIFRTSVPDQT